MDLDKLKQLHELYAKGAITEAEYQTQKERLMNENMQGLPLGLTENSYCALMNFTLLLPGPGWIITLILWAIGKETSQQIDRQGYYIANFLISFAIYGLIGALLFFFPALIVAITAFVLSLIAGINAMNGTIKPYPLTINFIQKY